MDDKRETPPNAITMPGRTAGTASGLHKLINLSRPHHLLELVGKAVGAAHGAIGLVSAEGDLQEHITFALDPEAALELRSLPWCGEVIRCILRETAPIKVSDFARDLPAC